jgi:hypothetical protein
MVMARLNPTLYPDRLVFERYARRVRRDELGALLATVRAEATSMLRRSQDAVHRLTEGTPSRLGS